MADLSQVEAARKEGYSDADIAAHLAKMDQRIKEALDSGYEPKDIFARLSKPVSVEEPKTYSDRSTIVPIASMIAQAPGAVSDLGVMGTLNAMRSIPGDIVGGAFDSLQRAGGNFRENEKKMGTPAAAMMVPADFLLGSAPSNMRKDVGEGNWRAAAGDIESIATQAGMMAAVTNPKANGGPDLGTIARSASEKIPRAGKAVSETVKAHKGDIALSASASAMAAATGNAWIAHAVEALSALGLAKEMIPEIIQRYRFSGLTTKQIMQHIEALKQNAAFDAAKSAVQARELSAFEKLAMQDTKKAQAAEFNLAKSISQAEDSVAKQAQRDSMSSGKVEASVIDRLTKSQAKASAEAKAAWDEYFASTGQMRDAAGKVAKQADERAFEAKQELLREQTRQAAQLEKNRGASPEEYKIMMDQIRAREADIKNRGVSPLESEITKAQILANSKSLKKIGENGSSTPNAPGTLLNVSRQFARGENPAGLPAAAEAPRSLPGPSGAIEKADPSLPLAERAEINLQRGKEATSSREARSQEIGAKTDATGWADTGALMDELKQMFKGKTFNRAAYDALPEKYKKINYNMARVLVEQAK